MCVAHSVLGAPGQGRAAIGPSRPAEGCAAAKGGALTPSTGYGVRSPRACVRVKMFVHEPRSVYPKPLTVVISRRFCWEARSRSESSTFVLSEYFIK